MRVLLDTQVFLLAAGLVPTPLPPKVMTLLADPDTDRILSAISIVEIVLKIARLGVKPEFCAQAAEALRLTIIPFTAAHATRMFTLAQHHKDPFDRMLIATALAEDLPVIAQDREFRKYRGLKVLWS